MNRPLLARANPVIERELCVIGGGSAGTYIDYGKSVVLLERTSRLGGHAETYIVPGTATPIDIGVIDFEQTPVVLNYFNRFNVNAGGARHVLRDPRHEYPYLDSGFQLPDAVPEELAEPFSSFVTTYGLQALVPTIFEYGQGAGSLLNDPALYVLKLFNLNVVSAMASSTSGEARFNSTTPLRSTLAVTLFSMRAFA
jgi:NAD(P)-binding Rossmann-like domain